MGSFRDGYSNFSFLDALSVATISAATDGRTIDRQGYETVTFVVNMGAVTSGVAATSDWVLRLEHGLASALGVSAWSTVPNSLLIHSVAGGYDSTATTGIFQTIIAGGGGSGVTYAVGYKGHYDYRYVRLVVSETGTQSNTLMHGMCILGQPANWAVNTPV
jgi:hypothetical protein